MIADLGALGGQMLQLQDVISDRLDTRTVAALANHGDS
jgi:hypothetical protein